jgi:hypothetical protein
VFASRNIALHAELLKEAEEKVALNPWAAGTIGAVGVGGPALALQHYLAKRDQKKARNVAFGAGMATGVATPTLLRKLLHIAQDRGIVAADTEGMS